MTAVAQAKLAGSLETQVLPHLVEDAEFSNVYSLARRFEPEPAPEPTAALATDVDDMFDDAHGAPEAEVVPPPEPQGDDDPLQSSLLDGLASSALFGPVLEDRTAGSEKGTGSLAALAADGDRCKAALRCRLRVLKGVLGLFQALADLDAGHVVPSADGMDTATQEHPPGWAQEAWRREAAGWLRAYRTVAEARDGAPGGPEPVGLASLAEFVLAMDQVLGELLSGQVDCTPEAIGFFFTLCGVQLHIRPPPPPPSPSLALLKFSLPVNHAQTRTPRTILPARSRSYRPRPRRGCFLRWGWTSSPWTSCCGCCARWTPPCALRRPPWADAASGSGCCACGGPTGSPVLSPYRVPW